MSQSIVALFSGQGAQRTGMGREFFDRFPAAAERFRLADEALGHPLSQVMFEGPEEELTRTSRCQPALYLHGLIGLELLQQHLPDLQVVACAGLSLGEFTAHAAAGTFDFATGLRVVEQRGLFMEQACEATKGGMAAMIGGEEADVVRLAEVCGVEVANFNAPGQIVLSGTEDGIAQAVARAKEFGIRIAKPLTVAGAYHSNLMTSARDQLAALLAETDIQPPQRPVWCNVDARPVSGPDDIRDTLTRQVTGSVRWVECIRGLIGSGHTRFVEFGPGRVLSGMLARIDKSAEVHQVEDIASLEATAAALAG